MISMKSIPQECEHVGHLRSGSNMYTDLLALLQDGVIMPEDLEGFSKDLQERFAYVMRDR